MGTYLISEKLNDVPGKFTCKVSFNSGAEERYEVESTDAATIDAALQAVADAAETASADVVAKATEADLVEVVDGKVVVDEAAKEEV